MAKGPIYNGPCVVEIASDAEIKYVPNGEGCGIFIEQTKNGYLIAISKCCIHKRKDGMQFSLSSLVTFGWEFSKIREIKKLSGEIIWKNEVEL